MLYIALAFITGIFIASKLLPGMAIILGSFLLALLLAFINRHRDISLKAILLLTVCLFGMFLYTAFYRPDSKLQSYSGSFITIAGVVITEPVERASYTEYLIKSSEVIYGDKLFNYKEKLIIRYKGDIGFKFGDKVNISGKVTAISGKRNPGDFDFVKYYKSKGIYKIIQADEIALISHNNQGFFAGIFYKSKSAIKRVIYAAMPEKEAAIMYGVLTGSKSDIDEESMEAFKKTGIAHVLSVSGLHIGFLVLILGYMLKPFRLSSKVDGVIKLIALLFYIAIIGFPTPAVRAFLMFAIMLMGKLLDRDYNLTASVSFAAILLLLINPLSIHNPGFIISFCCIYSIAALYEPIRKALKVLPTWLRESLSLSLAVWIGIMPILAWYFNYVSIASILLNLAAVPLAFVITSAGFVGVLVGLISQYLSMYIFSIGFYAIRVLTYITSAAADIKIAGFLLPTLPIYFYALYYMGVLYLFQWFDFKHYCCYKSRYRLAGCALLLLAITVYVLPGSLRVTYFDVGQGDSACIVAPNKRVLLVDGGGSSEGKYYYNVGRYITVPALLHQGIWRIDTIMVSHAHDDHMEGLIEVLKSFKVKNLIFPKVEYNEASISPSYKAILDLCALKRVKVVYVDKGDTINLGRDILGKDVKVRIMSPSSDEKHTNPNNTSIVAKLIYRDFEALFTGDIEKVVEQRLQGEAVRADILKVPHHGSKTSSSDGFIDAVKPLLAVIPVGKNNFGHPSADVLEAYSSRGIKVFRTDENGAVTITTNGKSLRVSTVK